MSATVTEIESRFSPSWLSLGRCRISSESSTETQRLAPWEKNALKENVIPHRHSYCYQE